MPTPPIAPLELHQTIIADGGHLTEDEALGLLRGKIRQPEMRAIIALIEYQITTERNTSEARSTPAQTRDECTGAIDTLKTLRHTLLTWLKAGTIEENE
jgi:hypothetical protein